MRPSLCVSAAVPAGECRRARTARRRDDGYANELVYRCPREDVRVMRMVYGCRARRVVSGGQCPPYAAIDAGTTWSATRGHSPRRGVGMTSFQRSNASTNDVVQRPPSTLPVLSLHDTRDR